ncbi:MAG: Rrf2 family transcriptional regulator [Pseudomonadota bacterium]|nr:Rrf2 family transcriptional regulator [Pseudomonadota bacterium]MEC7830643.1 Rrf2 family transcriptional regulator [Pseudomonadota bacterium]MEC9382611.1 Rrf2 family transcriptional regulator [Pseudomonadota bacterium]MEC9414343.1 Rrf2 family transcriptional regulator [Pseudomonadota bacterium]MEC9481367.1 Rrf2 family transcriptional regulator [Pseudomonadota bacterium]
MKLTTKGRYAVLALTEIALSDRDKLTKISEISKSQNISSTYLEQILSNLKNNGFVESLRGPSGGYRLAIDPDRIKMGDVIEAIEGKISAKGCINKDGSCTGVSGRCLNHDLWDELGKQVELFLGHISLKDIIDRKVLGRSRAPLPFMD